MKIEAHEKTVLVTLDNGVSIAGHFTMCIFAAHVAGAMRRQEYPVCLPADEARRFDNFAQLVTAAANMRSAHHKL